MSHRYRTAPLLLLVLALWAGGCMGAPAGNDLSVEEAHALIRERAGDPGFVVLDVRTPEEFAAGHIEGAVNIDWYASDFREKVRALDRETAYLVYCRTGVRSAEASAVMAEEGFGEIYNMEKGIAAWKEAGYPVVT
ncbi:rhodanese-like domain-containing protein [Methanofollis aquaemaris]|uniref:Rhodanese-like domain-containing protein n=1 Tax=Methanofollis aquaemaris TaxID=126734 RepID=A0A8A3S6B0_9EURY|nr:rhodanese-like domain-containing protein [Methanofollis aquaemaris]QSZ67174.1 rhodanese-like domain-containing protein [Methanofollis aquaemaris]